MRLPFRRFSFVCLVTFALAACGGKTFDSLVVQAPTTVLAARAGDSFHSVGRPLRNPPSLQLAATRRHLWNETLVVNAMVVNAASERVSIRTSSSDINRTGAAPTGDVWACMSVAETSNDPAMGPTYWTEWGVIRDVIEDYGTPDEQAAIFDGTASAAVRFAPVERFAAENGFGGWGVLTKQKCGL